MEEEHKADIIKVSMELGTHEIGQSFFIYIF